MEKRQVEAEIAWLGRRGGGCATATPAAPEAGGLTDAETFAAWRRAEQERGEKAGG